MISVTRTAASFCIACACITATARASSTSVFDIEDGLRIKPHAYGHLEAGQIVKGTTDLAANTNITHIWTEDAVVGLSLEAFYKERLRMRMGLEGKLYFSYPMFPIGKIETKRARQDFYFTDVDATCSIGNTDSPVLRLQAGHFAFKYNPDSRNLGEYMFRSGTYPGYIWTHFDFPAARLLGFNVQSNLFESLQMNLLFTSETFFFPVMNWSLAMLASYDIANLDFVEIGAGVDFAHLFSTFTESYSTEFVGDPTTPEMTSNDQYIDANGDTLYYTFKGTKVMARMSIDPKAFIKWDRFGENDLKLYVEACILGTENYPDTSFRFPGVKYPSYNNIFERMPIAFGLNLPAFKLLDVFNVEAEFYQSRYLNDASQVMKTGSVPLPSLADPDIKENFYKISVYLRRNFFNRHFFVTAQIARDHMRLPCAAYNYEIEQELLPQQKDWWWVVKTSWMF